VIVEKKNPAFFFAGHRNAETLTEDEEKKKRKENKKTRKTALEKKLEKTKT